MLFKMIKLPSDESVEFVGCYVLKWGGVDEPTVGFREATPEETAAEGVQADGAVWRCKRCFMLNSSDLEKCGLCNASRR